MTSNDISKSPGTLVIYITTNDEFVTIPLEVPIQTLRLTGYRVKMDDALSSLATKIVYIDIPFLNGNKVLDTNPGFVYFPLFLGENDITLQVGLDIPILMSRDLPVSFQLRVLDSSFTPVANFNSLALYFETELGSL